MVWRAVIKNLVPSRSLVTRDLGTGFGQITRARDYAREGRGKARVTEKRGKKLLCASSVQWILILEASRCFSFLCTYQTCKLMLFSARFILSAVNYPWCLRWSEISQAENKTKHRRTGNFLPGGAVNHLPKKISQVAQIFTKKWKRNEGHIATT